MSTLFRMRFAIIMCFLPTILAFIVSSLCPLPDYCERKLERHTEYDYAAIANSSYIREEIADVNLESCAQKCLTHRCACSAILHNKRNRSCKLLSTMLDPQSVKSGPSEEGWEYYTTPKGTDTGWLEYRTHFYFLGQTEVPWIEAKSECEARCSHLVEIETKEESDWLAETFVLKDTCSSNIYRSCIAWTGGNDIAIEGRYQWSFSNMSIDFKNWKSNEPGSLRSKEDCIQLLRNGKWNDESCTQNSKFICEKSDGS